MLMLLSMKNAIIALSTLSQFTQKAGMCNSDKLLHNINLSLPWVGSMKKLNGDPTVEPSFNFKGWDQR